MLILSYYDFMLKFKRILTIFAHPDDETLAAGATISKLSRNGSRIFVAIPATGILSRKNTKKNKIKKLLSDHKSDTIEALSIIGVKKSDISFGDFADNELDKYSLLNLVHWIETIIEKTKPDAIFTHHRNCTNIDHKYCHEAVVVATRPNINSHISVFCGEVPSSTGYLKPANWDPNLYVNVSKIDLNVKIKAMQKFKQERRKDPHPRSPEVLKALAKVRGSEAGYNFAESFMIHQTFNY